MNLARIPLQRTGSLVLLAATIVVGLSILAEGALSRLLNGMAGIAWFAAAGMLVWCGLRLSRKWQLWVGLMALTAVVAFVVRPTDIVLAMIGFALCGAAATLLAGDGRSVWALVVVGLYLPMHIGTAVLRAVARSIQGHEATIRTDPPPTAAIVPLVMLLAAAAGALIAQRWLQRSALSNNVGARQT